VTAGGGRIAALDAGTFEQLWRFPEGDEFRCANEESEQRRDPEAVYSAPVVEGGHVYFGAYDGNVYAVNAADGACEWVFEEPEGAIIGGIAYADGVLYFGSDDGKLYAVDAESGERAAEPVDVGSPIWTTPLIDGSTLYFTTVGGEARALKIPSLEPEWQRPYETSAGLIVDPAEADDALIVGGIGWQLIALDRASGTPAWDGAVQGDNWFWGDVLVAGGRVYAPNLDGKVYAVRVDTGQVEWTFDTGDPVRAKPLLVDGRLIVVDRAGDVYALDPQSGEPVRERPVVLGETVLSNPIEVDGRVFVSAEGGDLYEIDPSGESPPRRVQS
jgi:outer membrane protein assembly factor BamB